MRLTPAVIPLLTLAAACSSNPPATTAPQPAAAPAPAAMPAVAAPAPAPAPMAAPAAAGAVDLSGSWNAAVDAGGQTIPVDITLARGPSGYTGEALPQGMTASNLTALTIQGDRVSMSFNTPEGEAVFAGTLSADRRNIVGAVAYQGQSLPFTMTKR